MMCLYAFRLGKIIFKYLDKLNNFKINLYLYKRK